MISKSISSLLILCFSIAYSQESSCGALDEDLIQLRSVSTKEVALSYPDKIRRKILPLIVFNPNSVEGNPAVEVLVKLAPNGEILEREIIKTSGYIAWDTAVLHALDNAKTLHNDGDKVPSVIRLTLKPKY